MYMPQDHNHSEWLEKKKKYDDFKKQKGSKKKRSEKEDDEDEGTARKKTTVDTTPERSPKKLALSGSIQKVLTTQHCFSIQDAQNVFEAVKADLGAEAEDLN